MIKNTKLNNVSNIYSISFPKTKRQFSCFSKLKTPTSLRDLVLKNELDKQIQKIDNNASEINLIQKQIVDHIDSKKGILSDLAKIEPAKKAVEKLANNETPLKKEFTAYSHLQNEYEEHLLSDSESDNESQSSFSGPAASGTVDTSSSTVKQSKHEKLDNLKTYLTGEFQSATSDSNRLKKLFKKLTVENEKKRKIEESSDNDPSLMLGQSKKNRQSVHDFVEDLPTDFNPFDDIGSD